MTMTTLAFDVYGTLIDTAGVTESLRAHVGDDAAAFADAWRVKQLEYTFRYGLMDCYQNFRECTRQALDFCCASRHAEISDASREELMARYRKLPVFNDVVAGLNRLRETEVKMYAFSNGLRDDLEALLAHAGIRDAFADIVSVDEVATFKPNPIVYRHFLTRADCTADDAWLISGNPFDICGARAVGMHAFWLRRNRNVVFDPWHFVPDRIAENFADIAAVFTAGDVA